MERRAEEETRLEMKRRRSQIRVSPRGEQQGRIKHSLVQSRVSAAAEFCTPGLCGRILLFLPDDYIPRRLRHGRMRHDPCSILSSVPKLRRGKEGGGGNTGESDADVGGEAAQPFFFLPICLGNPHEIINPTRKERTISRVRARVCACVCVHAASRAFTRDAFTGDIPRAARSLRVLSLSLSLSLCALQRTVTDPGKERVNSRDGLIFSAARNHPARLFMRAL